MAIFCTYVVGEVIRLLSSIWVQTKKHSYRPTKYKCKLCNRRSV